MEDQQEENEQDVRIMRLQDLIEKNIEIEQQIENKRFDDSILAIETIIKKSNEIAKGQKERRTNPTELVLDSELLRRNHEVVGKAIQYNTNFTDQMIFTAIFGIPLFTNDSMIAFIDVAPKQHIQKNRGQRTRKPLVEEKRPTKSDKLQRKEEGSASVNSTLKQIRQLYRTGNDQPIPYFKLVCHPTNFMDSVQNALNISFLVQENMIYIEPGNDNLPQIRTVANPRNLSTNGSAQAICAIDVNFCQKMVKHYNIQEPMLKRLEKDDS
ncbi:GL19011 [Drosophila persimilis]|uniref:Non-structural maintenance of chromosomes element 4 n=1 Tax=Drosophila persimilis TaxID=7234 RepID=B4G770_DROPE|nr:GL19011 [Drosophila persimilis]